MYATRRLSLLFLSLGFLAALPAAGQAQPFVMASAQYKMSVPLGSLRNFSDEPSFAGMRLDWQYFLIENRLSVGLGLSWSSYRQDWPRATYPIDNGAITSSIERAMRFWTFEPEVFYYFIPEGIVRPFVGLGLGATLATFETAAGLLYEGDTDGAFLVSPKAGVLIRFFRGPLLQVGAIVSADYTFTGAEPPRTGNHTSSTSVHVGLYVY